MRAFVCACPCLFSVCVLVFFLSAVIYSTVQSTYSTYIYSPNKTTQAFRTRPSTKPRKPQPPNKIPTFISIAFYRLSPELDSPERDICFARVTHSLHSTSLHSAAARTADSDPPTDAQSEPAHGPVCPRPETRIRIHFTLHSLLLTRNSTIRLLFGVQTSART